MEQNRIEPASAVEPMEELIGMQKRMLLHARITTLCSLALSLALLIAVVVSMRWIHEKIDHAESSLTAIDQLVEDAGARLEAAGALMDSTGVLIDNANTMVTDNAVTVAETVEKLNEVDIEGLNEAIDSLNTAIEPLTKFANLFR